MKQTLGHRLALVSPAMGHRGTCPLERMHANFADLTPDGFHFWIVTTNFGTRAPRARAPWSKILATPLSIGTMTFDLG